jgi:hypothetical protein
VIFSGADLGGSQYGSNLRAGGLLKAFDISINAASLLMPFVLIGYIAADVVHVGISIANKRVNRTK